MLTFKLIKLLFLIPKAWVCDQSPAMPRVVPQPQAHPSHLPPSTNKLTDGHLWGPFSLGGALTLYHPKHFYHMGSTAVDKWNFKTGSKTYSLVLVPRQRLSQNHPSMCQNFPRWPGCGTGSCSATSSSSRRIWEVSRTPLRISKFLAVCQESLHCSR